MSSHYTTEPPATASVLLRTSAGPLTISLFAGQTPLTCRNFLQHVLDGYYENNIFHRISPGFVIQTGDPTGTGEGGENIYEDRELENYDGHWARLLGREKDEKIVFGDEIHSRLKFNRRGLVGMAKGTGDGAGYGSQFFITLGDCRAELDGRCTMFGRVEGEGIYNVVKIAEGELTEGTERPVYAEKIVSAEVLEMPKGEHWQAMKRRERVARRVVEEEPVKKKVPKKKGGKALLSFGGDEGDDDGAALAPRPKKAKFNTALIDGGGALNEAAQTNGTTTKKDKSSTSAKRKDQEDRVDQITRRESSPQLAAKSQSPTHNRKPSFHDSTTQLPLRDPESPSRSPTPSAEAPSKTAALQAEIAALKNSMRRDIAPNIESKHKKSALESLIPTTSTRGRKRPRPGQTNAKEDASALNMLNAFKARLETAQPGTASHDAKPAPTQQTTLPPKSSTPAPAPPIDETETEEATLCDLHFIAQCQSCSNWDKSVAEDFNLQSNKATATAQPHDDDDANWMSHALSFEKDRLGKDLTWKRKQEEELVVIDPREREKELKSREREKRERRREKGKATAF